MAIILDSSFILAFDNLDDFHNKKAKELWKRIEGMEFGQYFISDYIFDEIIAVSMRKISKERAFVLGQQILKSVPIINIDKNIFNEAWNFFKESKLNLSFTDCTNLALLKLIGSKNIVTFDKAFKEIKEIDVIE